MEHIEFDIKAEHTGYRINFQEGHIDIARCDQAVDPNKPEKNPNHQLNMFIEHVRLNDGEWHDMRTMQGLHTGLITIDKETQESCTAEEFWEAYVDE